MKVKTLEDLEKIRKRGTRSLYPSKTKIMVGMATCGRAAGAQEVYDMLVDEIARRELDVSLGQVGCIGWCCQEPLVDVLVPGKPRITYGEMTAQKVPAILEALTRDEIAKELAIGRLDEDENPIEDTKRSYLASGIGVTNEAPLYKELGLFKNQLRVVLRNCGFIDPKNIDEYIARGGYLALHKVLNSLSPEEVIEEITKSGLRGRGGAGFPTGLKWKFARQAKGDVKYVICNADEGDPGAYMDRSVLEGDPHSVIEGMIIGAYAIGAAEGYIYVRAEYPLAVEILTWAIQQAEEYGFLGENIFGLGMDFRIHISQGAGAFVCGEETALMASIEGRTGEPRPRPPFPAQSGLWGKPTNINNVETWANVPVIIARGGDWYHQFGTEQSGGTKIFSVVGNVNNTGLVEVPIGTSLGDIVFDIGGGIPKGKKFKAAQLGGPSGGCVPREHLNVPIDYTTLQELGAIMGSGGMVICDDDTCMVELARFFLNFVQEESCGKCVPCRVGTKIMLEVLTRITQGQGQEGDIEYLVELGEEIKRSALCGLGQTAPNPVLSTIRYFRDEYEAHIRDKRCPAGVCQDLVYSPCQNECPAGQNVPAYVSLIGEGRFEEALEVILDRNPFPSVCGRVCDHPCESKCRRSQIDDPVAIRELKRFAADYMAAEGIPSAIYDRLRVETDGQKPKVAIVGSGPAGLSCAYFLARLGYRPTVFEKLPVAGGMLAVGIPEYRLPKDVLQRELEFIEKMGVEIRTGVSIGEDITIPKLHQQGYEAIFIGVGAHHGRKLNIPGEDLGVVDAVDFLREVNLNGGQARVGQRVAVLGGGNAAIDAARTALRLGADEVTIVYRRTRNEMPAQRAEIEDAVAEGVKLELLAAPGQVISQNGTIKGLECLRMCLGEFDRSGRRRPEPVEDSQFRLDVDLVISAIGQSPDTTSLLNSLGLELNRDGTIKVDKDGRTTVPYIFAGGDAVTGPATVIWAIAAGERAAVAIDQYLSRDDSKVYPWRETRPPDTPFDPDAEPAPYGRLETTKLAPDERRCLFAEVEAVCTREAAVQEALRCLRCEYREEQSAEVLAEAGIPVLAEV
jgi:NADH-quinone oxidoreductase subunit F